MTRAVRVTGSKLTDNAKRGQQLRFLRTFGLSQRRSHVAEGLVKVRDRLRMIQAFLAAEIAIYEYDCTGASRKADLLLPAYRDECDLRGPLGPIQRTVPADVSWDPARDGTPTSELRLLGHDIPSGASALRDDPAPH